MARNHNSEIGEGEQVILRGMFPKAKNLTIKEIMKNTPYSSYERNNSYLKSLAKKKIIKEEKIGKTLIYSLIPNNWHSKKAFHSYSLERARVFSEKHKIISSAVRELQEEELDFCAVFGSYAKGTEKRDSDIDLLCVTFNKEKIEVAIATLKRRYGLNIQAVILPRTEFDKIKNENPEFWDALVKHGIIFKGYELFYHYAYEI